MFIVMFNRLKNIKKKIVSYYWEIRYLTINTICYFIYDNFKLDENLVFIESRDGLDFTGNMFRIAEELSKEKYKHLKIYVYAKGDVQNLIKELKQNYKLKDIHIIDREAKAVAIMERAKYIVSDSGIPWRYVKRKGQIVLNTWHGTPLKLMGKYVDAEKHAIGTVQHFFLSSDYLLYPSVYMKEKMLDSFMVENVLSGKVLLGGYPRNSVFFNVDRRSYLRKVLGLDNKIVYAYLPTHRGSLVNMKNKQQLDLVIDYLTELDAKMNNNQVLFVKLHVFNQSKIDFAQFEHVKPFPGDYETYDVLNATDCLITDYSSVLFDYANTRNKIILFTYDEEEYFEDRGTYFSLEELPFPKVKNVEDLLEEMNISKNYDDEDFIDKFCTYDRADATELLCEHVFRGNSFLKEEVVGNGKENVLVMGGSLAKNGITTALVSLLNNADTDKRNYFVTYNRWEINNSPERVNIIPKHISYLPMMNAQEYTLWEKYIFNKYAKETNKVDIPDSLKNLFKREVNRYFFGVKFSHIIQFDGYGINVNLLFNAINCPKSVFVHNDMVRELKTRRFQHYPTLFNIYNDFDNVAVVSEDLIEFTAKISEKISNIKVVNNLQDIEGIITRSLEDIRFDRDTDCVTNCVNGIEGVLSGSGKVFINIGRFSQEKGHERLIKAFDVFCEDYPDTQLIILGGHGVLYNKTIQWVKAAKNWKNITVIKSMKNPMPILKRCDLFILSSFYEGLPMTIKEADILKVPVIATDIPGVRSFIKKYNGYIVDDSQQGILEGMYDFMYGKVKCLDIDYRKYNEQALKEFESLFSGE